MAITLGLRRVRRVAATGRVYVIFSDKAELEFNSVQEVKDFAQALDGETARDLLRRALLRWWLHRNPAGDTPATVEGKTITLDLSGATLLEVR